MPHFGRSKGYVVIRSMDDGNELVGKQGEIAAVAALVTKMSRIYSFEKKNMS